MGKASSITVNGRTYTCAANGIIDVPAMDAPILAANNWAQVAGSGSTAQRPTNPFFMQLYHDTSISGGTTIVWEGSAWRNPASGAAV